MTITKLKQGEKYIGEGEEVIIHSDASVEEVLLLLLAETNGNKELLSTLLNNL